jgi:Protein of unknown function (DUF2905)
MTATVATGNVPGVAPCAAGGWPTPVRWRERADVTELGRALLVLGVVVALVGLALMLSDRIPWIGRLPGDIHVRRGHWSLYVPLGTSVLLSLVLTLILWLIGRR